MNISVKKFSKKSFSLLIALIMVFSALPLTPPISVEAADGGYEVLGNVTLDPIIYTHGAYNGNTDSEYAYMMYGSTIADGSFDGECKTAVSVSETSTKTISSVEAVDVSGASLKVENGLLKGSLGTTYEGPNKVDTTVTLKFTFSDGTYEYHKMPVKTNPVAQHVAGFAQRWTTGGTFLRGLAVESLAVGSYGQTNSGSYSATTTKTIGASATHNYKKMYEPFNSDKSVGAYCTDKKFYGFIDNAITTDKQNGYAAIANGNNKDNVLTVNSLAAKYYIDLSSSKNYGIVQSNGGYYIDILVGKIYDNFNTDCNVRLDGRSATGLTESSLIGIVNSIDTTVGNGTDRRGYIRYKIDNPTAGSTIEATTYISYRSDNRTYAQVKLNLPINIQITNKSNTRKLYNDYISDLAPRCYTADSWATFRDELLKVEEYLNDNTDTSTIDTTDLENAYNGLKPSEDANAHTSNGTYKNTTSKDDEGKEIKVHQTTCKFCDAKYNELHNLVIDSDKKIASCSVCSNYSVSSGYSSNGFRITKGNLFDVDAFAASQSNQICVDKNRVKKGAVSVDIVNDTITVAGSARDAYTNYGNTNDYYGFDVEVGKYYSLSYTPSTADNQAFAFFYKSNNEYKKVTSLYSYNVIVDGKEYPSSANNDEYFVNKYSAPAKSKVQIIFQAPEECTYIKFRFGTVESGGICTFSDISFYECDPDGTPTKGYEVLKSGAQNGDNVLSSAGIPSEDKCKASYAMYNNDGEVGEGDTVSTNLNLTFDSNHSYSNKYTSGDTATVECSKCGHHYELDYSAYNAELTILQDKLADTERYTSSSIVAATNAMNDVTANVRQPLTKDEVDALVDDLMYAEDLLVVKTFTLTYNVYLGEDKTELKHTEKLNNVPYGESKVLTIPSNYQTDYAVTKWTRTIESSDSIIGTTTSSLTIIANSNASYNVFIKSTADPVDTDEVTATLNNKSNKVVDVAYVKKGTSTVSIKNSSITLTNGDSITTLTAPSYSFYKVSGFTVNGLDVYNGSSVEINDTTVIRPIYDVNDRFTVVLDTNVKTNKGETGSVEKGWDERITVTADDADENTQWLYKYQLSDGTYSKAEVIGYGKTVSLQVTQSCMISYKNGQTAQPQVSMDYVSYNVYKAKTITAVGRYYLPENCTKVRAGVILKTSNQKKGATNTPSWVDLSNKDNYKITNKSGVFEATSFVNGTNQYAINFYSSSDYQTMYIGAVAYLTYTDANGEHTIYSDIATYEYKASAE